MQRRCWSCCGAIEIPRGGRHDQASALDFASWLRSRDDDVRHCLVVGLDGVELKFAIGAEHVLCAVATSHAAKNDTIEERVAAQAVFPMHPAGSLACHVEP